MQRSSLVLRIIAFTALSAALLSASQFTLASPFFMPTSDNLPPVISYQGLVRVNDSPYSGTGYFKFAIVNASGNKTYWSNDGTSAGGEQPGSAVSLTVNNGLVNVLLGDTNLDGMSQALTPAIFRDSDCFLRVWFSQDGSSGSFSWLTPDRRIASVPFALNADSLDGLDAFELSPLNRPAPPSANDLTVIDSAGNVGQYTSITIGTDGLAIIAYYDVDHGNLKAAHCNDTACSSASTATVDDSVNDVGKFASIILGADGLPIISYYDATSGDLRAAHCGSADCTTDNTITVVDDSDDVGQYSSIAIGSDGLPVISYFNAPPIYKLKIAHCGNVTCSGDNTLTVVDTSLGQHGAITIGVDGLPIISYSSPSSGKVEILHCGDIYCSNGNQINTYGLDGHIAAYTSITINTDGLPIISFSSSSSSERYLLTIQCNDLICSSSASPSAVETFSSTPYQYSSFNIGADGLPILSYYHPMNGNLKIGHCTHATPSSSWIVNSVDSTSIYVGNYNSITTGADGLPIISYYDATAGDLKVAHCSNPFCSAYFRRR